MRLAFRAGWIALAWTLVFSAGSAGALPVIGGGLVAHYAFEGNADDSSSVSNHGTIYGDVTYSAGVVGQSSDFDGTGDYILIPSNPTLSFHTSNFSVNVWINQPDPLEGWILDERSGPERGYGMGSSGTHASFWTQDAGTGSTFAGVYDDAENDFVVTDDGNWHMLTGVRNGGTLQLFIDGDLRAETVGSTIDVGASNPIFLRRRFAASASEYGRGLLDELSIYDRALSPAEVQTLYSAVPEPSTALLLGVGLVGMGMKRRRTGRGC